ncbi:MAG: heavy metal-associated domain-containing protein [Bacteroidota bacterium]
MKATKFFFGFSLVVICSMMLAGTACSQDKKVEIIKIKTSAVCSQCKERIEGGMAYEKGVKDVSLDVDSKVVTIKYNVKSTTPDELRRKISKLGYDADSIPGDKVAYEKLPACCKKDAAKH